MKVLVWPNVRTARHVSSGQAYTDFYSCTHTRTHRDTCIENHTYATDATHSWHISLGGRGCLPHRSSLGRWEQGPGAPNLSLSVAHGMFLSVSTSCLIWPRIATGTGASACWANSPIHLHRRKSLGETHQQQRHATNNNAMPTPWHSPFMDWMRSDAGCIPRGPFPLPVPTNPPLFSHFSLTSQLSSHGICMSQDRKKRTKQGKEKKRRKKDSPNPTGTRVNKTLARSRTDNA